MALNSSKLGTKDPADVLNPITFDFAALVPILFTLTGTATVTVIGPDQSLVLGTPTVLGLQVFFQVLGGTSGATYTLAVTVSDTAGNTWHRSTTLTVAAQ